jgi:hypothetical protein
MSHTTTSPASQLAPCKGDWMQRGCKTGKPSVHRVFTHGAARDCCAYHSPYDVDDRRPAGWIAPEAEPSIAEHGEHQHGLDTLSGYAIVRTAWHDGPNGETFLGITRFEVQRLQGAARYAEAVGIKLRLLRALREHGVTHQSVVIDTLYECGCRSDRVDNHLRVTR